MALRVSGDLHFANAAEFRNLLWRVENFGTLTIKKKYGLPAPRDDPVPLVLLLDMQGLSTADASAAMNLHEAAVSFRERGVRILLVRRDPQHLPSLIDFSGLAELVESPIRGAATDAIGGVFESVDAALDFLASPNLLRIHRKLMKRNSM
jgi:hypothetical protein